MRLLSVRLIISLIIGITLVSSVFSYYEVLADKRTLRTDVERRDEVLGESLAGNVERIWNIDSKNADAKNFSKNRSNIAPGKVPDKIPDKVPINELQQLVQRFGSREHLL